MSLIDTKGKRWHELTDPANLDRDTRYDVAVFDSGIYSSALAADKDKQLHRVPNSKIGRNEVYEFMDRIDAVLAISRTHLNVIYKEQGQ